MAITLDTSGFGQSIASATVSFNYTLAAGAQLWVGVAAFLATGPPIPNPVTVKYNGVDLINERDNTNGATAHVQTWQSFTSPLTGDGASHALAAVWDVTLTSGLIVAASFFGVDTTTTLGKNVAGTSTTPSSGSQSPSAGTLVVDSLISFQVGAALTPTANGAQSSIISGDTGANSFGYGISTREGGSSFSMDWTLASSIPWFSQSIILNPASADPFELEAGRRMISVP